ncbi:tetratricopeptide repeat protein [Phytopseudomonas punonensis]|uniref:Flp pilus assembly protein TadD, contains TPR repeats n=1 Tax=Phytopseudomonas punonensis TaxID=1220495 RepID=A0A1M7AKE8_9GAMM|nr:tetratricopeptide repeat protein [Pseudomonas punonensis]SHL43208.1 Flp pilus assembly protein TadD, contains TPR repeats [Pseudomonas punonensis]
MKRVVTVVGVMGLLAGCANGPAQSPWLTSKAQATPMACAPLSQDQELALNLAHKTAEEGRLHAALANLERLPANLPQARLSKARILRSLNRPEAGELYSSLTGTCLKAQGEQGLGQLASAAGRYPEALEHLRLAASLDPTSAPIRNDLGVVYMNLGRLDEARFELLTALELNETEQQPALNLLTLLIYQGMRPQANALAERMGFSAAQLRAAEERAQAMRSKSASQPVSPAAVAPVMQQTPVVRVIPATPAAEPRVVPADQPVATPTKSALLSKPVVPAVQPSVAAAPPSVPAPRLSNFRPTPVVPLSLASAAAKPAFAEQVAAVQPAKTPAVPAPVVRAPVAPVAESRSVVASAPAPATVAAKPAPAAVAVAPAPAKREVAAAPQVITAPAAPVVRAPVAAPAPVVASAPVAPAAAPAAAVQQPARAGIEMRAGRLIVPDDGGFVRVEPVGTESVSVN